MEEVDRDTADAKAREAADNSVRLSYPQDCRQTVRALSLWWRVYWAEFRALTQP